MKRLTDMRDVLSDLSSFNVTVFISMEVSAFSNFTALGEKRNKTEYCISLVADTVLFQESGPSLDVLGDKAINFLVRQ